VGRLGPTCLEPNAPSHWCRTEYALEDYGKPIGISEYRLAESLPEKLQGSLPTVEELESELGSATEE